MGLFGSKKEKKKTFTFRGESLPVMTKLNDFTRAGKSGLQIQIENYVEVYGELLTRDSRSYQVSPSKGPCYLICAKCEVEIDEQTMASLGSNSVMAAFGVKPVTECRECGSPEIIIVKT